MKLERIRTLAVLTSALAVTLVPWAAHAQDVTVGLPVPGATLSGTAPPLTGDFVLRFSQNPPAVGTATTVEGAYLSCNRNPITFYPHCNGPASLPAAAGGVGAPVIGLSCPTAPFVAGLIRCLRVTVGTAAATQVAMVDIQASVVPTATIAGLIQQELGDASAFPRSALADGYHYDARHDRAVIVVNADGSPWGSIPTIIDEDDRVTVAIVGDANTVNDLHVSVRGCTSPPTSPRVDTTGGARMASGGVAAAPSFVRLHRFGPCSGESQVRLIISETEIPGDDRAATNGTPIPINPLYRFSVGVAAGFDATEVRRFETFTPVGSTTPVIREARDAVGFSSLVSIGFHPCARDYAKSPSDLGFWRTVCSYSSLFVGVDPARLTSGFVLGLGAEIVRGLDLYVGWRVLQRNPVLLEASGLAPGQAWDRGTVPTEDRWELGSAFLGVGINQNLLRSLLGR